MTERQHPRIEHAVVVYLNKLDGTIKTRYALECGDVAARQDYDHVATLDPALWIAAHWDEVET